MRGFKEYEKAEKIQEKYFRWILRAGRNTPGYIIMEETKRRKIRYDAGKRAMKFEILLEKARDNQKQLLAESWSSVRKRTEECKKTKWLKERVSYYEANGYDPEEARRRRMTDPKNLMEVCGRDKERQQQEQIDRIWEARYNPRYRSLRTTSVPLYLKILAPKNWQVVGKYRCGGGEKGNQYWRAVEDRTCRFCGSEVEELKHWTAGKCEKAPHQIKINGKKIEDLLDADGRGWRTLRMLEKFLFIKSR